VYSCIFIFVELPVSIYTVLCVDGINMFEPITEDTAELYIAGAPACPVVLPIHPYDCVEETCGECLCPGFDVCFYHLSSAVRKQVRQKIKAKKAATKAAIAQATASYASTAAAAYLATCPVLTPVSASSTVQEMPMFSKETAEQTVAPASLEKAVCASPPNLCDLGSAAPSLSLRKKWATCEDWCKLAADRLSIDMLKPVEECNLRQEVTDYEDLAQPR
jgi:hypothetical protein